MGMRYSTTIFVEKAKRVHGDKYDYSNVNYVDSVTPVSIVCPEHGAYKQRPAMHLEGKGCPICAQNRVRKALSDTQESFVEKARLKHGDKYDYSFSEYKGSEVKLRIICPIHGVFWQTPHSHLSGQECPSCGRLKSISSRRKGLQYFLEQARAVHGDKYDYSKICSIVNRREKVCIICPIHGEFWQTPYNHTLQKQGCPKCARVLNAQKITKNTEWFLEKARAIHGTRYDYSDTVYTKAQQKLCIICHERDDGGYEHGRFWITPHAHLSHAGGCPKCGHPKHTIEWFITRAKSIHGDRYDFALTVYENNHTPVIISCPEHGPFSIFPSSFFRGAGCPKCGGRNLTQEEALEQFVAVHGDRYDYSKVQYINKTTDICIICRKHGEFWQTPFGHLHGQGCPTCNQSHLENVVELFLKRNRINYEKQKIFPWLVYRTYLKLDFFLPDYGIAIECQGEQHFVASTFMGGEAALVELQKRDHLKEQLCVRHGINVFYYSDLDIDYPYPVFEDLSQLLKAIKSNGKFDLSLLSDPELPFEY